MKKIFFFSFILLSSLWVSAQQKDSTQNGKAIDLLTFRPYAEFGVNVFLNRQVIQNYQTNSALYWSLGIRLGSPRLNAVNMFFQYTGSRTSCEQYYAGSNKHIADSTLKISQFSAGFVFPLIVINDQASIRTRAAYTLNSISDSYYTNSGEYSGFTLGLGLERKLEFNSKVYIEGSYNFIKMPGNVYYSKGTPIKTLENMNMFRLTLGLNL